MLLATILLLCPLPQSGDIAKAETERPAAVVDESGKDSISAKSLPSTPEAKIKTDSEIAGASNAGAASSSAAVEPATPATPAPVAGVIAKPAGRGDYETAQERKQWWALVAASSGAAFLDAWSTRRAISGGYGSEANPLLRPFAHSGAMYAAVQVSPVVMDLVGRKMMTSKRNFVRKLWWVPQMAGTDVSASAAIHNLSIAH